MVATTTPATPLQRPLMTTLEELKGYISPGEADYAQGYLKGRRAENFVFMRLRLTADDLELCVTSPEHRMRLEGYVQCEKLWGKGQLDEGSFFQLFIDTPNPCLKLMVYRIYFQGDDGPFTLSGFKELSDDPLTNVGSDCLSLFSTVYRGRVTPEDDAEATPYAVGIIKLHWGDFFQHDVLALRFKGPHKRRWRWRFLKFFFGTFIRFIKVKCKGR